MKKLFQLIVQIIPLLLILLAIAGYFFYEPWQNWCDRQYNKIKGVCHVYLGDKALEKSKQKGADITKELAAAVKFYNIGLKEYP